MYLFIWCVLQWSCKVHKSSASNHFNNSITCDVDLLKIWEELGRHQSGSLVKWNFFLNKASTFCSTELLEDVCIFLFCCFLQDCLESISESDNRQKQRRKEKIAKQHFKKYTNTQWVLCLMQSQFYQRPQDWLLYLFQYQYQVHFDVTWKPRTHSHTS